MFDLLSARFAMIPIAHAEIFSDKWCTCFHGGVPGDEMISKEVLVQPGGLLCFGKRRPCNVGRGYLRKISILR